jgi:hypothetical protein
MHPLFEKRAQSPAEIRRRSVNFRLAGWVFLALAFLLLWGVYDQFSTALDSKNWPVTKGEVTEFDIRYRNSDTSIYAYISYTYTVQGKSYTNTRFSFAEKTVNPQVVASRFDAYPAGNTVPVYYNPRNPSQAVLEAGSSVKTLIKSSVSYFALVLAILILSGISFRYASRWQVESSAFSSETNPVISERVKETMKKRSVAGSYI